LRFIKACDRWIGLIGIFIKRISPKIYYALSMAKLKK